LTPEQHEKLEQWNRLIDRIASYKTEIDPLVKEERILREEVMNLFFPDPKEGTNKADLANGWQLKGVVKIKRDIDEAALETMRPMLVENGIAVDKLIRYKSELEVKVYKELVDVQMHLFDGALKISRSASELTLVPPKGDK